MNLPRSSGMLLHISSLPGRYGIGTLGDEAYEFADTLKRAGQRYWQILPIGPVVGAFGFSPYASPSTFAGNPLFISIERMINESWCALTCGTDEFAQDHFVDFERVVSHRAQFFAEAARQFFSGASGSEKKEFDRFCAGQADWLDDYALYMALSVKHGTFNWLMWDTPVARREPAALARERKELEEEIRIHLFVQYQFFRQWKALREYCNDNGIELIGDIPIYITLDGADAWANPEILDLDPETGAPLAVAGVPPDYFSETGQRWGNPLYWWHDEKDALREETLSWWKRRISHLKDMVDIVRIDHFRGFESFWSVPADEETAVNGEWVPGPGMPFFSWLRSELGDLPLIAEDLGVITPEVKALRDGLGLPGMKILQFAFDFNAKNEYLPHNIETPNCLLYTGTHDNNTTNGWFYGTELSDDARAYVLEYIGSERFNDFHWQLIRLAYMSVARLVIVPVQDMLGYGHEFRMNTPGTAHGNWGWKLVPGEITDEMVARIARMTALYNRSAEAEESARNGRD